MTSQLTTTQRLAIGFSIPLSLIILIAVIGALRVGVIDTTLSGISEGAAMKQRYAINFRGSVHDRAIAIRDAVLVDSDQELSRHLREIDRLDQFYQDSAKPMAELLGRADASADEKRLMADIAAIENSTQAIATRLIALRRGGERESARELLLSDASPAYAEWLRRINAFIDHQEAIIQRDIDQVQRVAGGFNTLILAATAAAVLLSLVVGGLIIRWLQSVLGAEPHEVKQAIRRLAEGELDQAITSRHADSVMGTLRDTLTQLAETVREVRRAAARLTEASGQLHATADNNNQQIRLQASESEQMAAAINQMSATVNEVASYAANAAAATRNADSEVEQGNQHGAGSRQRHEQPRRHTGGCREDSSAGLAGQQRYRNSYRGDQ